MVREWERHENFSLYEDALPVLDELRRHDLKIGLVSNGQRDLDEFAAHHALDVDAMVGSRRTGASKPHPSIFVAALRALEVAPAEAAMVGDSYEDDIEGARALGIRAILLDRDGRHARRSRTGSTRCSRCRLRSDRPGLGTSSSYEVQSPELAPSATPRCARRVGTGSSAVVRPKTAAASAARPDRSDADVLALEERRATRRAISAAKIVSQLGRERLLLSAVLAVSEVGTADELAESREELRLERADGEVARVRGLVDPVAGEPTGEHPRDGLAAEPVRDEVVGAVGHRDGDACAPSCSLPLEQRGEHAGDGAERTRGEVCDLNRRQAGRRVLQDAGPAEVVEVVAGALRMCGPRPRSR